MKKIIIAVIISIALFTIGWNLMASIRNRSISSSITPLPMIDARIDSFALTPPPSPTTALTPVTIADCDEQIYPQVSSSEEDNSVFQIKPSDKPYGPEELFSAITDGQTLHSILKPQKISNPEIALISKTLAHHLRPRDLAAGDLYRILANNGVVENLVIQKLDAYRLPVTYRLHRKENKFHINVVHPVVHEERHVIEVTVKDTLYQSFSHLEFGNELMQELMNIFFWEMRMPDEVFSGDRISMLVVKKIANGKFIGYKKIEHVLYEQKNRSLTAIFFESKDKKIQGYYDENGRSLEREFSVSAVAESVATSNQQLRLHPVRKIRIRHNGTDFRGTIGTEFYTIADGKIIEKKFDVNVGNMIRILHKYGVVSEYFHADTIDNSLVVGQKVTRGQRLGTIGRTGRLCTGPHLHLGLYTMRGDDKQFITLNSLRKILKPMPNITNARLSEFAEQKRLILTQLNEVKTKPSSVAAEKAILAKD